MSDTSTENLSLGEKARRAVTWFRVPLAITALALVVMLIHDPVAFWCGVPVAFLGEFIQLWSLSHINRDQRLTTSGPYAYVRNPMYIGRFFLILGAMIMTGNPYLITGYVVVFAIYAHLRVKREEARLRQIFQPDFQLYCSEVRRWLPRLKPYSRATARRASWSQLKANGGPLIFIALLMTIITIYLLRIHGDLLT